MDRIIFSLKILLMIFFISFNIYAEEPSKKMVELSMDGLISEAEKHQISIIDWRYLPETDTITIDPELLKNQESWIEFLKKQFPHCWAITEEGIKKTIYLLPQGVDIEFIPKAKQIANEEDVDSYFISFENATKLTDAEILKIPEIIVLQALSSIEKSKTISYQRLINPQDMKSSYNFKVRYIDELQMMVPVEKNGKTITGEMEAFTSFNTFYNFIVQRAQDLQAWRFHERVYLKFNDNKSIMMLSGSAENMQIASRVMISDKPRLEVSITGNQNEFKSITNIYHAKGTLKYVDIALIH